MKLFRTQLDYNLFNKNMSDIFEVEYEEDEIEIINEIEISDCRQSFLGNNNPFFGLKHSIEQKEKWSKNKSGKNNPFYGKKFNEETIEVLKKKATGRKHTEETKKKLSEYRKGREPWNKGKKGLQVAWNKGLKMK